MHSPGTRWRLRCPEDGGSADLDDARGLDDGRLPLPFGEFGGLFAVGIDASKPLPVLIEHGNLPVPVLAPAIFPELGASSCGVEFGHGPTISIGVGARKYQLEQ